MNIDNLIVSGEPLALTLSKAIIDQLEIKDGDELEVYVIDQTLIIRTSAEANRARQFRKTADRVFAKYYDVFEALATASKE